MNKRRLSSTTTTTATAKSSESFADLLKLQFESFTEDELTLVAVAILVLLVLCAVGVVAVFYQCRRLQRTIVYARQRRQKRRWEQERQVYRRRRNRKGQDQGLGRGGGSGNTGRDNDDDDDKDDDFVVKGTTKERINDERRYNVQAQQVLLSELQEVKQVHTELQDQVTMLQKLCALKYRPLLPSGQPKKGHDRRVTPNTVNTANEEYELRNDVKNKGD